MATFTCQRCGKTFEARQKQRLYCGHKCANALAGPLRAAALPRRYVPCETCGNPVYSPPGYGGKRGRFCSRQCRGVSMRGKPATGAIVPGNSGVGVSGFRPDLGHFCRSRWEANYARYLLAAGHTYAYEPARFVLRLDDGTEHGYTPDFLVDGVHYVEVKGWMRPTRRQAEIVAAAQQQLPLALVLVDANAYRAIKEQHAAGIPGWEHAGDPKPELPKRLCPMCGKIVTSIFLKTVYCSRSCFNATGRKPKEAKQCLICSAPFDVSPWETSKVTCSRSCSGKLKYQKRPVGMDGRFL